MVCPWLVRGDVSFFACLGIKQCSLSLAHIHSTLIPFPFLSFPCLVPFRSLACLAAYLLYLSGLFSACITLCVCIFPFPCPPYVALLPFPFSLLLSLTHTQSQGIFSNASTTPDDGLMSLFVSPPTFQTTKPWLPKNQAI